MVCVDDEWGARLAARTPGAVTVSATAAAADWRAGDVAHRRRRQPALHRASPRTARCRCGCACRAPFNVANALVALACLDAVGVPPAVAAERLRRRSPCPAGCSGSSAGQPFLAVVDYAHKPAAVAALLDALRAAGAGAADRRARLPAATATAAKRPLMGAAAAAAGRLLVVTDDNPRSEDPAAIRAAVLAGARGEPAPRRGARDRRPRARRSPRRSPRARPGDAVVVAGKGHETGQEVGGVQASLSTTPTSSRPRSRR